MSTQTNTNTEPTFGKKLFVILIVIFFSFSFIHKPNPPQSEPIAQAKQATLQDLSNEIPFYQSEIYLKNQNNPNLQKKVDELLATSNNQKSISSSPILEEKSTKKDLKTEKLTFNDELGVFVNNENKADLIAKTALYIKKYQKRESPLDPEMIVEIAQKNNFPLDLILVQTHQENHFCTNGGDRLKTKNCWNVGNNDRGDNKPLNCEDGSSICLDSYQKGFELYIHYMSSCHFHEGEKITIQKFFDRNFSIVRRGSKICGDIGARYATDVKYRENLASILHNNFNPIFSK